MVRFASRHLVNVLSLEYIKHFECVKVCLLRLQFSTIVLVISFMMVKTILFLKRAFNLLTILQTGSIIEYIVRVFIQKSINIVGFDILLHAVDYF